MKIKKDKERKTIFKKNGQSKLFLDGLMKKVKSIMIGTRAAGTARSCSIVMAFGNGVVRSNSSTLLKGDGGSLELAEISKSTNWAKRKDTTGKIEPS